MLAEELTEVLLPLLRLGASNRDPVAWSLTHERLQTVFGLDPNDDTAQERLQRETAEISRALRQSMRNSAPNPETAGEILDTALEFVGPDRLRQAFAGYRREIDFERVRDGFRALLHECTEDCAV